MPLVDRGAEVALPLECRVQVGHVLAEVRVAPEVERVDDGRVVLVGSGDRGPRLLVEVPRAPLDHIDLARVGPTAGAAEVAQQPDRGPGARLGR